MGSLTEAIYGYVGSRPTHVGNAPRYSARLGRTVGGGGSRSSYVSVIGAEQSEMMLDHLLTSDPEFEMNFRKLLRKVLKEARNQLSKDFPHYVKQDPRKAARAVKYAVYRQFFGGNISILQKRKRGAYVWIEEKHKLRPGQRGGNRRDVNERTFDLKHYGGADRGFILRFINGGTDNRQTKYGNRGSITQTNWFAQNAPKHIQAAAAQVAEAVNEYIKHVSNG